jgi:hypothetical protein
VACLAACRGTSMLLQTGSKARRSSAIAGRAIERTSFSIRSRS